MSDYKVFNDILGRINSSNRRIAQLETTEHPTYSAHAAKDAAQAISSAPFVDITLQTKLWSTGGLYTAGATSFAITRAGRYLITFHFAYTAPLPVTANFRVTDGTYNFDITEYPTVTGKLFVTASVVFNLAKDATIKMQANNAADVNALTLSGGADPYVSYVQVSLL